MCKKRHFFCTQVSLSRNRSVSVMGRDVWVLSCGRWYYFQNLLITIANCGIFIQILFYNFFKIFFINSPVKYKHFIWNSVSFIKTVDKYIQYIHACSLVFQASQKCSITQTSRIFFITVSFVAWNVPKPHKTWSVQGTMQYRIIKIGEGGKASLSLIQTSRNGIYSEWPGGEGRSDPSTFMSQ